MTSSERSELTAIGLSDKGQQAMDLMATSFDLINGDAATEDWLEKLAILANCESAMCVRWSVGQSENALTSVHGEQPTLPLDWLSRAEWIISSANPAEPGMLDDLAINNGLLDRTAADNIFGTNAAYAYLDWAPARILIIFSQRLPERHWSSIDRERLRYFLPQIRKSILLHKKITQLDNKLNLANKLLNEFPRASITLTIKANVSRVSNKAKALLTTTNCLHINEQNIRFSDADIQATFVQQLQIASNTSLELLPTFAWHLKIAEPGQKETLLITLRAYALDNWTVEASAYDRLLLMHIERMDTAPHASVAKLRAFYELTDAQARLVAALLNGEEIEGAAASMHVSVNTARSHLRSVYAKLDVNSRSQLLQKLTRTTVEWDDATKRMG